VGSLHRRVRSPRHFPSDRPRDALSGLDTSGRLVAPGAGAAHSRPARLAALLATVALVAFLIPAPALSSQGTALFPESAIRVGMTGVGKTVFVGTRVSDFQVRILGILHNGGPAGDLVLFRASGGAISSVGGLAAGMSGSPVYLGGRLAGAFSYSLEGSDPMVGLFTPVEDMMRDLPSAATVPVGAKTAEIAPVDVAGTMVHRITVAASSAGAPRPGPGALVAVPAVTPLFVSGLGAREQAALAQFFAPMDVIPMVGGSSIDLPVSLPLDPGSAISVAVMRGDIGQYAVGTLTYRDGDRILGFGHPFTNVGSSNYLLTNASILQIVRGTDRNIKIGAAGPGVGIVSEDRPAAIAGMVGRLPRMFGVRVLVTDGETGAARRFTFQVVPDKVLVPTLVTLGAQGVIERALNRSGAGTADVRMILRARGLDTPIVRVNRFFSSSDIAARALTETSAAMRLLFDNDFTDLVPTDVEMDVQVTRRQETAVIAAADVAERSIPGGATIHVHVTIRPFRGEAIAKDVALAVPATFVPGPALLVIRAGVGVETDTAAPAAAGGTPGNLTPPPETARTLPEAVDAFEHQEEHTDLVVELVGGREAPTDAAAGPGAGRPVASATTPWVLAGRIQVPILITESLH